MISNLKLLLATLILSQTQGVQQVQSHFKFVSLNSSQHLVINQDLVALGGQNQQIEQFSGQKSLLDKIEMPEYSAMLWFKIDEESSLVNFQTVQRKIDIISFDADLNCYLELNKYNSANRLVNRFVCEHESMVVPTQKVQKRIILEVDPIVPLLGRWLHLTLSSFDYQTLYKMYGSDSQLKRQDSTAYLQIDTPFSTIGYSDKVETLSGLAQNLDLNELKSFDMFWIFNITIGRVNAFNEALRRRSNIEARSVYLTFEFLDRSRAAIAKNNVQVGSNLLWTYHIFNSQFLTNFVGENSGFVYQITDVDGQMQLRKINYTDISIGLSEISQISCDSFNDTVVLPKFSLETDDFQNRESKLISMSMLNNDKSLSNSFNQEFLFSAWININGSVQQEVHNWFLDKQDTSILEKAVAFFRVPGVFSIYFETLDQLESPLPLPVKHTYLRVFQEGRIKSSGQNIVRDISKYEILVPHNQWVKIVVYVQATGGMSIRMHSIADQVSPLKIQRYSPSTFEEIFYPDFKGQYEILKSFKGMVKEISLLQQFSEDISLDQFYRTDPSQPNLLVNYDFGEGIVDGKTVIVPCKMTNKNSCISLYIQQKENVLDFGAHFPKSIPNPSLNIGLLNSSRTFFNGSQCVYSQSKSDHIQLLYSNSTIEDTFRFVQKPSSDFQVLSIDFWFNLRNVSSPVNNMTLFSLIDLLKNDEVLKLAFQNDSLLLFSPLISNQNVSVLNISSRSWKHITIEIIMNDQHFHDSGFQLAFISLTIYDLNSDKDFSMTFEVEEDQLERVQLLSSLKYILGNSILKNQGMKGGLFDQLRIMNEQIPVSQLRNVRHQMIDLANQDLIEYSLLISNQSYRQQGLEPKSSYSGVSFVQSEDFLDFCPIQSYYNHSSNRCSINEAQQNTQMAAKVVTNTNTNNYYVLDPMFQKSWDGLQIYPSLSVNTLKNDSQGQPMSVTFQNISAQNLIDLNGVKVFDITSYVLDSAGKQVLIQTYWATTNEKLKFKSDSFIYQPREQCVSFKSRNVQAIKRSQTHLEKITLVGNKTQLVLLFDVVKNRTQCLLESIPDLIPSDIAVKAYPESGYKFDYLVDYIPGSNVAKISVSFTNVTFTNQNVFLELRVANKPIYTVVASLVSQILPSVNIQYKLQESKLMEVESIDESGNPKITNTWTDVALIGDNFQVDLTNSTIYKDSAMSNQGVVFRIENCFEQPLPQEMVVKCKDLKEMYMSTMVKSQINIPYPIEENIEELIYQSNFQMQSVYLRLDIADALDTTNKQIVERSVQFLNITRPTFSFSLVNPSSVPVFMIQEDNNTITLQFLKDDIRPNTVLGLNIEDIQLGHKYQTAKWFKNISVSTNSTKLSSQKCQYSSQVAVDLDNITEDEDFLLTIKSMTLLGKFALEKVQRYVVKMKLMSKQKVVQNSELIRQKIVPTFSDIQTQQFNQSLPISLKDINSIFQLLILSVDQTSQVQQLMVSILLDEDAGQDWIRLMDKPQDSAQIGVILPRFITQDKNKVQVLFSNSNYTLANSYLPESNTPIAKINRFMNESVDLYLLIAQYLESVSRNFGVQEYQIQLSLVSQVLYEIKLAQEDPNLFQAKFNKMIKIMLELIKSHSTSADWEQKVNMLSLDLITSLCSLVWCQDVNKQLISELSQTIDGIDKSNWSAKSIYNKDRFFVHFNSSLIQKYNLTQKDVGLSEIIKDYAKNSNLTYSSRSERQSSDFGISESVNSYKLKRFSKDTQFNEIVALNITQTYPSFFTKFSSNLTNYFNPLSADAKGLMVSLEDPFFYATQYISQREELQLQAFKEANNLAQLAIHLDTNGRNQWKVETGIQVDYRPGREIKNVQMTIVQSEGLIKSNNFDPSVYKEDSSLIQIDSWQQQTFLLIKNNATERYGGLNLSKRSMENIDWYEKHYLKEITDTIQEPAIWITNLDLNQTISQTPVTVSANFTLPSQFNLVFNKTATLAPPEDPLGLIIDSRSVPVFVQEVLPSNQKYQCQIYNISGQKFQFQDSFDSTSQVSCQTRLINDDRKIECVCRFTSNNIANYMLTVSNPELLRFKNGEGIRYLVEYKHDIWHQALDYVYKFFEYILKADAFNIVLIVILVLFMIVLPLVLVVKDLLDKRFIEREVQKDKSKQEFLTLFREIQNSTVSKHKSFSLTSVYKRAIIILDAQQDFFENLKIEEGIKFTCILGTVFPRTHPFLNLFSYYDHTLQRPVRSLIIAFKITLVAWVSMLLWENKGFVMEEIQIVMTTLQGSVTVSNATLPSNQTLTASNSTQPPRSLQTISGNETESQTSGNVTLSQGSLSLSEIVNGYENKTKSATPINQQIFQLQQMSPSLLQGLMAVKIGTAEIVVFVIITLISQLIIFSEWPKFISRLIRSNSPLRLPQIISSKKVKVEDDIAPEIDITSRKTIGIIGKIIFVLGLFGLAIFTVFYSIKAQEEQHKMVLETGRIDKVVYFMALVTVYIQIGISWLIIHPIYIIFEAKYVFGKIKTVLRSQGSVEKETDEPEEERSCMCIRRCIRRIWLNNKMREFIHIVRVLGEVQIAYHLEPCPKQIEEIVKKSSSFQNWVVGSDEDKNRKSDITLLNSDSKTPVKDGISNPQSRIDHKEIELTDNSRILSPRSTKMTSLKKQMLKDESEIQIEDTARQNDTAHVDLKSSKYFIQEERDQELSRAKRKPATAMKKQGERKIRGGLRELTNQLSPSQDDFYDINHYKDHSEHIETSPGKPPVKSERLNQQLNQVQQKKHKKSQNSKGSKQQVELRMTVHDVDEAKEVAKNSVRIEEEEVDKTIRINDVGLESEIDPDLQSEQSNNRKYHEILAELNKIDQNMRDLKRDHQFSFPSDSSEQDDEQESEEEKRKGKKEKMTMSKKMNKSLERQIEATRLGMKVGGMDAGTRRR